MSILVLADCNKQIQPQSFNLFERSWRWKFSHLFWSVEALVGHSHNNLRWQPVFTQILNFAPPFHIRYFCRNFVYINKAEWEYISFDCHFEVQPRTPPPKWLSWSSSYLIIIPEIFYTSRLFTESHRKSDKTFQVLFTVVFQ